jgi:hypothetical protein
MSKYTVYSGKFPCHTCKAVVGSVRHYPELKELTWVCAEKHLSKVSLETKRNKKEYEREVRE